MSEYQRIEIERLRRRLDALKAIQEAAELATASWQSGLSIHASMTGLCKALKVHDDGSERLQRRLREAEEFLKLLARSYPAHG